MKEHGMGIRDDIVLCCRGFRLGHLQMPTFTVRRGQQVRVTFSIGAAVPVAKTLSLFSGTSPHPDVDVIDGAENIQSAKFGLFSTAPSIFGLWWLGNPTQRAWLMHAMRISGSEADNQLRELTTFSSEIEPQRRLDQTKYYITRWIALAVALQRSPLVLYSSLDLDPVITSEIRNYTKRKCSSVGIVELAGESAPPPRVWVEIE